MKKSTVVLALLVLLMFGLRLLPWNNVFTPDGVNFARDDAVEHMKLAYYTVANFPQVLFFDNNTNYPYGSPVQFGPVFTYLIAIPPLAFACHPTKEMVDVWAAFLPAIMGALCLIPVYLIAKRLWPGSELYVALIFALLPGQFLSRSLLGFTDHHVAEVFFSTWAMYFFIIMDDDHRFGWLCGLCLGLYLLTWPAAMIMIGGITLYMVFANKPRYSVLLVPLLMALPFCHSGFTIVYYSWFQTIFVLCCILLVMLRRTWLLWVAMINGALIGIKYHALDILLPTSNMNTVAEAQSSIFHNGILTLSSYWYNFAWSFPLAVLGFLLQERKRENLTPALWMGFVFVFSLTQERWQYYLAVPVALYVGLFIYKMLGVDRSKLVIFTVALLLIYPLSIAPSIPSAGFGTSPSWLDAMQWLKAQPDGNYSVISWWDYGHDINYWTGKDVVANPFQEGISHDGHGVANYFVDAPSDARYFNARYVVIDNAMVTEEFSSMCTWLGLDGYEQFVYNNTTMYRDAPLYYNSTIYKLYFDTPAAFECGNYVTSFKNETGMHRFAGNESAAWEYYNKSVGFDKMVPMKEVRIFNVSSYI